MIFWLPRMPGVADIDPSAPTVGGWPGIEERALIPFLFPWTEEAPDGGCCCNLLFAFAICCCRFCDVTLDLLKLCDWFFCVDGLCTCNWFEARTPLLFGPAPVPMAVCVPPLRNASLLSRWCCTPRSRSDARRFYCWICFLVSFCALDLSPLPPPDP